MKYEQFETHCHTAEVSRCGVLRADEVVDGLKAAGYAGTFITDHYNARFFEQPGLIGLGWKEKIARYLAGFHKAKKRGEEAGLTVMLGLEVQIDNSPYEFLVYGPDEQFLAEAGPFYKLPMRDFYQLMSQNGHLVFQAHPYRYGLSPENPAFFDGIEIVNSQPRHESRNKLALKFAYAHDIMIIAGGDIHMAEDIGKSGIMLPADTDSIEKFLSYYRQVRRPELIVTCGA